MDAQDDAEMLSLWKERERDPSANVTGPYVYRSVWGKVSRLPVMIQREYRFTRQNLASLLALLPDAHNAVEKQPMLAVIPVFAPQMDRMVVSYYSESIEHMGPIWTSTGCPKPSRQVVQKAAQFGTIISARVLAEI